MNKIRRNAPCLCGSGLKYKNCCGTKRLSTLEGLTPGIRMKGGIRSNPTEDGFMAIVHIWDNIDCRGEPDEWRYPEVFSTEEEAMQHYKTFIRPALEQLMTEMTTKNPDIKSIQRRLE